MKPWKVGTVTFSWDFCPGYQTYPGGRHVNRWGKMLRSARVWWGPFAAAVYRMDDYDLVKYKHEWEGEPRPGQPLRLPEGDGRRESPQTDT